MGKVLLVEIPLSQEVQDRIKFAMKLGHKVTVEQHTLGAFQTSIRIHADENRIAPTTCPACHTVNPYGWEDSCPSCEATYESLREAMRLQAEEDASLPPVGQALESQR